MAAIVRLRRRAPAHRPRPGPRPVGRVTRWLPVPPSLIARVLYGNEHPEHVATEPGYWKAVEEDMAAFVAASLPAGARDVRLALDPDTLEVVLSYAIGRRSRAV